MESLPLSTQVIERIRICNCLRMVISSVGNAACYKNAVTSSMQLKRDCFFTIFENMEFNYSFCNLYFIYLSSTKFLLNQVICMCITLMSNFLH